MMNGAINLAPLPRIIYHKVASRKQRMPFHSQVMND
jgi:hypothetical protein